LVYGAKTIQMKNDCNPSLCSILFNYIHNNLDNIAAAIKNLIDHF